jgi:hypothetical protein
VFLYAFSFSLGTQLNAGRPVSGKSFSFSRKQQYDIFKMRRFGGWPTTHCFKVSARDIVGAAIRVCRHIGKLELEDKLRGYIGDCFIPDEESVRPDPYKKHFLDYKGSSVCDDADAANLQGD